MRHLFTALTLVAGLLVLSFAVYAFLCWLFGNKPTLTGFTFVLVVNLMVQFYYEEFKRIDKDD